MDRSRIQEGTGKDMKKHTAAEDDGLLSGKSMPLITGVSMFRNVSGILITTLFPPDYIIE